MPAPRIPLPRGRLRTGQRRDATGGPVFDDLVCPGRWNDLDGHLYSVGWRRTMYSPRCICPRDSARSGSASCCSSARRLYTSSSRSRVCPAARSSLTSWRTSSTDAGTSSSRGLLLRTRRIPRLAHARTVGRHGQPALPHRLQSLRALVTGWQGLGNLMQLGDVVEQRRQYLALLRHAHRVRLLPLSSMAYFLESAPYQL